MQSSDALRVARVGHQSKHVYIKVCTRSDDTDTPRGSPRRRTRPVRGTRGVVTKVTGKCGTGASYEAGTSTM